MFEWEDGSSQEFPGASWEVPALTPSRPLLLSEGSLRGQTPYPDKKGLHRWATAELTYMVWSSRPAHQANPPPPLLRETAATDTSWWTLTLSMDFTSTTAQTQAGASISQCATPWGWSPSARVGVWRNTTRSPACSPCCWPFWMKNEVKVVQNCCLELPGLPSSAELPHIRLHLAGAGSTKQLWEPVLVSCPLRCVASQPYLVAPLL